METKDGWLTDPDLLCTLRALGFPPGTQIKWTDGGRIGLPPAGYGVVVASDLPGWRYNDPRGRPNAFWIFLPGDSHHAAFMIPELVVAWKRPK